MYTKHFDLQILPFENVPDPVFFFDQGDYHNIRNHITESLKAGRGLMVVTGPIGSGKTTMSQMMKSDFHDLKLILIAEPPGNSMDLFLFLAQELGLQLSSTERTFVIRDIREALLKIDSGGSKCLMIIDESHLMSDDTTNGIRLLNNLEEGSTKLIQILLLGQIELMETINKPEMEPFKQRIAALEIIGQMKADRIREYISHRIRVAGGDPALFSDTGWEAISVAFNSGGTPRTINSLCDRAFNAAFEKEKEVVDAHDVYEATQKLGLKTDVFHYIVSLKNRERKEQGTPPAADNSREKGNGRSPLSGAEAVKTEAPVKSLKPEAFPSTRNMSAFKPDTEEQKGLKMPVLFFSLSITALILSIFFFCQKSGSPDLIGCLQELLGL